jgi:lipopolysaccharide biosynthesis regulator YciM
MLWPREVKLSADTYDLAVALYRVCNQQDPQGLAQVQQQLDEFTTAVDDEDGGIARLQEIIDDAEAGHWTMAMKQTRNALAAQVRRP